jgi:hypothetical protein
MEFNSAFKGLKDFQFVWVTRFVLRYTVALPSCWDLKHSVL